MPITLYRARYSTNVERVMLALAHKALEFESVWIEYGDRSPVIEISGQELVPVIVDGDLVINDSLVILAYLEETYPDPPLFPRDRARRAETYVFLEWFDAVWKPAPNAMEQALNAGAEPDPEHALAIGRRLDRFERLLESRDYLLGDEFTAADCAAYPFLKFAAGRPEGDDELFHVILDEHQSVEGRPRLARWVERVAQRGQTL